MKKIKLLLTVAIGFLLLNCTDMKEGFLMTENARFYPDSLIISAYTDIPEEPMDSDFPYQSNQISGVDGTPLLRFIRTMVSIKGWSMFLPPGTGESKSCVNTKCLRAIIRLIYAFIQRITVWLFRSVSKSQQEKKLSNNRMFNYDQGRYIITFFGCTILI